MKIRSLGFWLYIFSITFVANPVYSQINASIWDVLRGQFQINHQVAQPEVQEQLRWLMAHPNYLQKLSESEPYIYHIVSEIKKRNLPGELALLPMIESAFNPFAYSGVGAAGLWQLMPATGNDLGLKQDWWFDARRSIPSSTHAALNYLTYLNKYFSGDWILAIAAYDAGAGTISRAIKNSGHYSNRNSFWKLSVPNETKAYVPRFLALAEIIKNPERYHITLPDIPHIPYFSEVNIGSQIDLSHAAKLAGISYRELIKLNPGYNHWATAPNQPFKLLIPTKKVADFIRNLASMPKENLINWTKHIVQSGDTLDLIAQRYFTTVKLIRELNQLKTDEVKIGQQLLIPNSKSNALAAVHKAPIITKDRLISVQVYKVLHIVQPGDNYATLEKKYRVSAQDIQYWNNLNQDSALTVGRQLILWKRVIQYGSYTVKPGDTLSSVARINNTQAEEIARLNPGVSLSLLKPGQKLVIG